MKSNKNAYKIGLYNQKTKKMNDNGFVNVDFLYHITNLNIYDFIESHINVNSTYFIIL